MRGYSTNTKYNQITPKPPKLESNNSQDRNSNRNLLGKFSIEVQKSEGVSGLIIYT